MEFHYGLWYCGNLTGHIDFYIHAEIYCQRFDQWCCESIKGGEKVAIIRGPIVYCLEETDNGSNLAAVYASADHPLLEKKSDAFGGIVEIEFTGWRIEENNWNTAELYGDYPVELKPVPLKAVPYACWNNRGIGEMTVWMKEKI